MWVEKCPSCAAKHLRAALAYAVTLPETTRDTVTYFRRETPSTLVARAAVLLTEYRSGAYDQHLDLALGLLSMAEDVTDDGDELRRIRLDAETTAAIPGLSDGKMFLGHVGEAVREGGLRVPDSMTASEFVDVHFDDFMKFVRGREGGE